MVTCLGVAVSLSCFLLGHIMVYSRMQDLNTAQFNYYKLVTLQIQNVRVQNKYCSFAITLHLYACKLYTAASYQKKKKKKQ